MITTFHYNYSIFLQCCFVLKFMRYEMVQHDGYLHTHIFLNGICASLLFCFCTTFQSKQHSGLRSCGLRQIMWYSSRKIRFLCFQNVWHEPKPSVPISLSVRRVPFGKDATKLRKKMHICNNSRRKIAQMCILRRNLLWYISVILIADATGS